MVVGYFTIAVTWAGYSYAEAYTGLGVSDVLFFSLYLGAARRFGLRTGWSAVAMVASFLATIAAGDVVDGAAGAPAAVGRVPRRERRPAGARRAPWTGRAAGVSQPVRRNSATVSMWCVCGNMSTGATTSRRYPSSASSAALPASVVGLHET